MEAHFSAATGSFGERDSHIFDQADCSVLTHAHSPLDGVRTNAEGKPIHSAILRSIPEREFQEIKQHLRWVEFPLRSTLHERNETFEDVYFLNRGAVSLIATMENGKTVEVGLIGSEGVLGMAALVGVPRGPFRQLVQIAGDGFRTSASALQVLLPRAPELYGSIFRFSVLLTMQIAQTAACNRLHEVEQRLARWLLLTHHRLGADLLHITHDFLAAMLGTDRPSVSTAVGYLQRKKAIERKRASVKILDLRRLENASCECYRIIKGFSSQMELD